MIRTLREALELSPENDKLRAHLAQTLLSAGQYADAAEQFKQVAQRDPADRRSRLGLARAFYALEQWSAAIVVLEELQGQGAPEHEVLLYLSRALLKEGSFGKAMDTYEALLDRWPDRPDAELDAHCRIGGEDYDEEDDESTQVAEVIRAAGYGVKL